MRPPWRYFELSVVAFMGRLVLTELSNWRARRRIDRYRPAGRMPRVSVLAQARNEEAHSGECVRLLPAQDYPDFEVVALNDHSTDRTGPLLDGLSAGDRKPRVLAGAGLSGGWLGKHWVNTGCAGGQERSSS